MEKYRKCNVCDHVYCYTTKDEKDSDRESLVAGLAAIGSIASAVGGTRYDMYEMGKVSDQASNKVVNYKKCPKCGSIDTLLISKKMAKYINKNPNYSSEELLEEAHKYLESDDFENAFCFANVACVDEEYLEGVIIKFLASYNINKISQISKIEDDFTNNKYYTEILSFDDCEEKEEFINRCNLALKERKNIEINEIKKQGKELEKMDEIGYNDLIELKSKYEENKLTNEKEYKKIVDYLKKHEEENKKTIKTGLAVLIGLIIVILIGILISNFKKELKGDFKSLIKSEKYYDAIVYYEQNDNDNAKMKDTLIKSMINKYKDKKLKDEMRSSLGYKNYYCIAYKYLQIESDNISIDYKCDGYYSSENELKEIYDHYLTIDTNGWENVYANFGYFETTKSPFLKKDNIYYLVIYSDSVRFYAITVDDSNKTALVEEGNYENGEHYSNKYE